MRVVNYHVHAIYTVTNPKTVRGRFHAPMQDLLSPFSHTVSKTRRSSDECFPALLCIVVNTDGRYRLSRPGQG